MLHQESQKVLEGVPATGSVQVTSVNQIRFDGQRGKCATSRISNGLEGVPATAGSVKVTSVNQIRFDGQRGKCAMARIGLGRSTSNRFSLGNYSSLNQSNPVYFNQSKPGLTDKHRKCAKPRNSNGSGRCDRFSSGNFPKPFKSGLMDKPGKCATPRIFRKEYQQPVLFM